MHLRYEYSYTKTITKEPTLEELKEKVEQINEAISSVSKCDLKAETKDFIIKELRSEKAELINLMHKKVNEL